MRGETHLLLCAIAVLVILTSGIVSTTERPLNAEDSRQEPSLMRTHTMSYTPHSPIVISSDADFESQGWPGNGTEGDPYVIEDLSITSTETGISILDTTVHFEIRNCIISAPVEQVYSVGLFLSNITDGTVQDTIIERHYDGIRVQNSSSCILTNNTASDKIFGFYLWFSESCTLTENTASDNEYGFYLWFSESCSLTRNVARDNSFFGFYLYSSESCTVTNNTASDNIFGFSLVGSGRCTLTNNTMYRNGLFIDGDSLSDYLHTVLGNTVNAKPLGYILNATGTVVDGGQYGQLIMVNCSGVTVRNGVFSQASIGIQLLLSRNCFLTNNTASDNGAGFSLRSTWSSTLTGNTANSNLDSGFYLYSSGSCILTNNTASSNARGFGLESVWSCSLTNNTASSNGCGFSLQFAWSCSLTNNTSHNSYNGFYVSSSGSCTLTNNTASDNSHDGFCLLCSNSCTLTGNTATGNSEYGMSIGLDSHHNRIYRNWIGYNDKSNAVDGGNSNSWDDGVSQGNYWSDYDGTGVYPIPGSAGSVDRFPSKISAATITMTTTTANGWALGDMSPLSVVITLGSVTVIVVLLVVMIRRKQ